MGIHVLLTACAPAPSTPPAFVRGGVVRDGRFEARSWRPGERVDGVEAPRQPECVALYQVELEDMARLASMGAPAPGTALAFSPDGAWLAIGSQGGSLRVVDGWTGAERAARTYPEAAVKQVEWSADGTTLYVGEQSPDATIRAVDAGTLQDRWSRRLADELETSALPPADDVYGIYSLPGAYAIRVLDGGDVLVAGAHGWTDAEGKRRNRSRLWRLGPAGDERGVWPAEGVADGILLYPAVAGDAALVAMSRSAEGPAPSDLPIGGVARIDLASMRATWTRVFPVLSPYFKYVFAWDALALDGATGFAGLGDGRAFLFGPDGTERAALSPGVPVLTQGVPIAAGVGFGTMFGGNAYFLTTSTNIPYGSADPATRPPAAHPAEETVHAVTGEGATLWTRQLPHAVQGVVVSPDGTQLLVGAGERSTDERTDLFGAVILDRSTGQTVTSCSTEGPAYFRPAWAPESGRLAVAESPVLVEQAVRGRYRVTVFR
jgi:WD40 repeat protein